MIASLCVWALADKAESPATSSALNAVAVEELSELLALVAKPLIASLWVCAELLKLVLAVVWAPSKATYSALNPVAVEELKELLAEVASPFIASLWVCAEADKAAVVPAPSKFTILVFKDELKAVSPATYSDLIAPAADPE